MKNKVLMSVIMIALFTASNQTVYAQTAPKKDVTKQKRQTSLYAELLGTSVLYSLNVEERWQLNKYSQLGIRVGFSTFKGGLFSKVDIVYVPIILSYSIALDSKNKHFFEFGAGAQIADLRGYSIRRLFGQIDYYNGTYVSPTASFNYRYQAPKGFMIKAGFTPTLGPTSGLVGLSLGYTF